MYEKKKRIKDRELLSSFYNLRCEICGINQGVVAHHIKTKKSGGPDTINNLSALCALHHRQIHDMGINSFCSLYPKFKFILLKKGWKHEVSGLKVIWFNPEF